MQPGSSVQARPGEAWSSRTLCAAGILTSIVSGYDIAAPCEKKELERTIIPQMVWEALSDEELIARSRTETNESRSRQYVDTLFCRHHAKVARWCLSFANDRESAADLAQDICAKAYQNLSSFRGQSKFSTWLFSIARNHCLNTVRARSGAPPTEADQTIFDALPDLASENPEAAVER